VIPASSEHELLSFDQHDEAACGVPYQQEQRPIEGAILSVSTGSDYLFEGGFSGAKVR
jgi:hypothetical protein